MDNSNPEQYIVPHDSILLYRRGVWMECEALWKESDPIRRANIARLLADMAATLADMEAEEARKYLERNSSNEAA